MERKEIMGRGSSSASNLQESDAKPLGGGGGGGNGQEPITVQPFRPDPATKEDALGEKGRAIGLVDAMEGANPFYVGGAEGDFSENCQRAVVAYEARRRGYDVIAQPTYPGDTLPSGGTWMNAFEGAKIDHVGESTPKKTQTNLEAKMHEYGNGSRCIVSIPGHVFNAENVNGKIRYIDAQTNTVYNSKNVFSRLGRKSSEVSILRTDKLNFSDDIKKSVTPVTETMKRIKRTKNRKRK